MKPVSKQYIPLSPEQRVATTLDTAENARRCESRERDATVAVNTAADTNVAAATAAYAARQVIYDAFERDP